MNIRHIQLKNFRCFENIDIHLHPQMNVIVGVNGTGKTSILEAIRIFIGSIFSEFDKIENKIVSPSILDDDVRLNHMERQYPVEIEGRIDTAALFSVEDLSWSRILESYKGRTKTKGKDAKLFSQQIQSLIRNGDTISAIPVVSYYSTNRYKKEKKDTGLEADGSRLRGYYNALDTTTNIWFFLNIIKTETLWELQENEKSVVLSLVRNVVKQCVPECVDLKHDIKQDRLIITQKNGETIPFNSLSDGVRSVLALVMEIALRCYLLNPSQREKAHLETPGIVLIDEIDLHLHPEWQLHILGDLMNVFPKIQFIVTTHAPLILSSLKDGEIFSISDCSIYTFPNQYKQATDHILNNMNVTVNNDDARQKLEHYRLLIEQGKGKSQDALALKEELVHIYGENHEEIRRTNLMLQLFD